MINLNILIEMKLSRIRLKFYCRASRVILLAIAICCFRVNAGSAQSDYFDPERDVPVEILASATGINPGGRLDLAVVYRVPENYHITARQIGLFFVKFDSVSGLAFGEPRYPAGKIWEGDEVYSGDVVVKVTVTAATTLEAGSRTIKALAGYQVCAETGSQQCFFPVEKELTLDIAVLPAGVTPNPLNEDIFGVSETSVQPSPQVINEGLVGNLESALEKGSLLALLLIFVGGILTSFTPCVYPIIPITVSYIGSRAEGKKLRGFVLSVFFVLGLSLMYSALGVIAALTGGVFGGLTQHPAVYAVMIAIFLAMGASMMGAFDLQLPASWQGKLQSGQRRGLIGAVLMGMAAGLIATPCVGPVLVALLSWVAKTGSVVVGFGLLFTFSLGLGLLFIVIGTFAGVVTALPQAGGWMEGVKHFFGWLLWGTAVYFASIIIPDKYTLFLWGAFLSLLGIYVGAFRPALESVNWTWVLRKWFGILSLVAGVFLFLFGLSQMVGWQMPAGQSSDQVAEAAPQWIVDDVEGAFARAAMEGKPLIVDFYADWCVACVELDHKTYNRPEVLTRSEKFVNLKMDFTTQTDWTREMAEKYQVLGMPTVIFFNPQGVEVERFVGFKNAAEVSAIMDRVLASLN